VSIGLNPTFNDVTHRSVEAFLIDSHLDLYGKVVEVEFIERLRGMIAFPGIEPLIAQMNDDVATCRSILGVA
jgi:riboflavin kinase/FMN adenylyltransferase